MDPSLTRLHEAVQASHCAEIKLRKDITYFADVLETLHSPATMETYEMVKEQLHRRLYDVFLSTLANNRGTADHSSKARAASSELMRKVVERIRYIQRRRAEAELREH